MFLKNRGNLLIVRIERTQDHVIEQLKSKTLTTPSADKDVGQQEVSFLLV